MKKSITFLSIVTVVLITSFILFSCAGGPDSSVVEMSEKPEVSENRTYPEIPLEAEEILHLYEEAVRTRNHDLFREILLEDSELRFFEQSGNRNDMHGFDAVAEFRLMFFNGFGPQEEFHLGEVRAIEGSDLRTGLSIGFIYPDGSEWISLDKRTNSWKIFQILDYIDQPGAWVTNRYQALTDYDGDGFLNDDERLELEQLCYAFYEGPHEVSNQLDDFYDENQDTFIDEEEIRRAGEIHFVLGPRFAREIFPWEKNVPHPDLDLNGNGLITDDELNRVWESMTGGPKISLNREALFWMVTTVTFPDAVYQPVPREVSSILDQLADRNGDGIINEQEQGTIIESLLPAEKEAVNYLEMAIDRGHDGWVDASDVFMILQDSAMGRGMVAEGSEPPYDVRTQVDGMLDRGSDGQVDGEDIEIAVLLLAGNLDLADEVSPELRGALDRSRDGRIQTWEIEKAKGALFYPHPADPDNNLDREMDTNHDGFIDPEEIGITAGVTNKGHIPPFEEQIDIVRRRSEEIPPDDQTLSTVVETKSDTGSEYYRKLGTIQDKTLAVVTLSIGTDKIDQETANGVIVFVENAFVNVGKVKVIDRANIQEIFKEYKFQSSGVIDESTAVEIGKLSGADIIVIGSINRVGGIFYLNIKLIAVQTAEIVGSSIAQAVDATEFLEMANQAVYKLF
jgi:Ca2+-binding EF-hand superfamily protein